MALHLTRSPSNRVLWDAFCGRFLDALGERTGPGLPAHAWLQHRTHRDLVLEAAEGRGVRGWLGSPFSFLGDLPERFGIGGKPAGLLTRRRLLARIAAREGRRHGIHTGPGPAGGVLRGHMLDGLLSELLPEGLTEDELARALTAVATDDFARNRNGWVTGVLRAYRRELADRGLFDPRSVAARVADRIRGGALPGAVDGAAELHLYGIHSLRTRTSLARALAAQDDVRVTVYLPFMQGKDEWDRVASSTEVLGDTTRTTGSAEGTGNGGRPDAVVADAAPDPAPRREGSAQGSLFDLPPEPPAQPTPPAPSEPTPRPPRAHPIRVQPSPDAEREFRWVAGEVKRLLRAGGAGRGCRGDGQEPLEPRHIAVVARSGFDDTRRAYRALVAAGVPATARIRTPLVEVPALRFLLELFRGAAEDWPYRALRNVLGGPYLSCDVELRFLDERAEQRRIQGLDAWQKAMEAYARSVRDHDEPSEAQRALAARIDESREALRAFADAVARLSEARAEAGWIEATLELLDPGIFNFRHRLSKPVADRWDVVRLDQRGVVQLQALLREWQRLELSDEALAPPEWHQLLRRLLEGHDLALSTPLQQGVQVLEAQEAALTPFRHVFVVHANDGEFPRPTPAGGVLTEEERTELQRSLPLGHRELDLERERTLWNAVTGADHVTVSYRTTDAHGQPLLPSLLVPDHEAEAELSRTWQLPDEPITEEELLLVRAGELAGVRESAGADASEPATEPGATELPGKPSGREAGDAAATAGSDACQGRIVQLPDPVFLSTAVLHAVAETHRRAQAMAGTPDELMPSPWSGYIRDPEVLDAIAAQFGDDRVWSSGQLETYGTCPFVFLIERVLELGATEEAEEETSALTFGGVAHDILERFHTLAKGRLPEAFDGGVQAILEEAIDAVRAEREDGDEWLGSPVLWRHTFRDICEQVKAYLEAELPRLAKDRHTPHAMEYAFGFDGDPIEITAADLSGKLVTVKLRGRIDRVDLGVTKKHGERYDVVDYKTSSIPAAGGYLDGATLQAALYMEAYHAAEGVPMARGGYRAIKRPGTGGSRCLVKWGDEKHRTAVAIAASIPARIRAGHFEPVQPATGGWKDWHPGIEITRGRGQLEEGRRFDVPEVDLVPTAAGDDGADGADGREEGLTHV